jgi:predicted dehydrogenase
MEKLKIGVIGCGNISPAYFKGCKPYEFMTIAACADLDPAKAKARAEEFKVPKVCAVEELLRDPEIKIILNLTIPRAHAEVNLAAISAGKHVYTEKPFAIKREDGLKTLAAAKKSGVRVGGAPDTFLGGGIQTCRKLIDDGWIGEPIAATAFMMNHGHEHWHPAPEFYYKPGGGPMLDMGPYYVTALVNLIGAVRRVAGSTRATFPERLISSQPLNGAKIKVETTTHLAGTLDFANGAIGTIITSFDCWGHNCPIIEIYGTHGSISVPDPNTFGGVVKVRRAGVAEWTEIALTHSAEVGRGIGLADMARGIMAGRPHRASGELACHVLDVMCAFDESSQAGKHIEMSSKCERPASLPLGLRLGQLD